MAEKDKNPKTATKPKSTATKPAAKTTATAKPATKTAASKPSTTAAKPTTATKTAPAAKTAATPVKKAAPSKTAASTKPAAKTAPTPVAAQKPEKVNKPAAATTAKPEKAQKQPAEKSAKAKKSGGSGKAQAVAAVNPKKTKIIIMAAVAFLLVIAIVIGIVVGTKSCNKGNSIPPFSSNEPPADLASTTISGDKPVSQTTKLLSSVDHADLPQDAFDYEYTNTTAVGYYGKVTGETYQRVKPVDGTKNEGSAFASEEVNAVFGNKARYPKYGSTLNHVIGSDEAKQAARGALVQEACYLAAWGTRGANRGGEQTPDKYTKMDANGYLYQYKNNEWIHSLVWGKTAEEYSPENYRQLYKHTAADYAHGMYREGATKNGVTYEISDDAEAVVKEITMRSRGYSSYGVTGLYAPAGEVIKVEISGADMNATGGISIHIGQALYNGQANNIWVGKNQMQRIPIVLTTLVLNKSTCTYDENTDTWTGYVGSFVGGPIYIRNAGVKFTTKISGGLEYLHFILGYTTKEEFNRIKETSKVPYFDLEVWNYGVLHSGPRYYAEAFSYDALYKAAILWEKVSSVTTTNGSKQGIVFIYDAFVAAGAAVAFPGRSSVNCPLGWMSQSLNYNTLVSSGSWGNFHEYHHNFQNYGLGSGADGETTNNGLNIVSYALFTNISSKRGIGTYGAAGLGGWNNYTSATWTLQRIKTGQITSTNGLAVYSTLLHNFGAEAFIKARGASGANKYFNKWATVTHNDMTYYAGLTNSYYNGGNNKYTPSDDVKNAKYPMFVPVACVYQTGRSYMYDGEKKYFKTMQPYVIANAPFNIDLNPYNAPGGQYAGGSIVIPDGFTYRIKSVTKPAKGSIEITDNFNVKYTPAAGAKTGSTSGQIVVTLEIVKNDGAFKVDDVDLILEFQISNETTKMTLDRTTYTYTDETMYSDAVEAFNANFAGSATNVTQNQFNPTQNANTDIWFYPDTEANRNKYPDAPDKYFFHKNNIEVINGKLYFDNDGTYRVYLRGRNNCALYYSPDGTNYSLGARITKDTPIESGKTNAYFRPSHAETYFDVMFDEGKVYIKSGSAENFPETAAYTIAVNENGEIENWLYIREVLIVDPSAASYIGVGMRQWTDPQFTQQIKYYRDNAFKNEVSQAEYNAMTDEEKEALFTKTYYLDNVGAQVSEEEVINAKSVPPTVANVNGSQPYVNAYRSSYEFPNNNGFEADYFYVRDYNFNYVGETIVVTEGLSQTYIEAQSNYVPWRNTAEFAIGHLFDGDPSTYIHSGDGAANMITPSNPAIFTIDAGKEITANTLRLYTSKSNNNHRNAFPKDFTLQGSLDGETFFDMGSWTNKSAPAEWADFELSNTFTFRYYKLTVTATRSGTNRLAIYDLQFADTLRLTGNGANHITPDNAAFVYSDKTKWNVEQGTSNFGLLYHGKNGGKVKFEFTGTRVAVLTSALYDSSFEVWVDGKKVDSINIKKPAGTADLTYISEPLSNGKHSVEIRCTGDTYIDSFVLY